MRASMRGSIRSVIVTDSVASLLLATADSINRRSGRFSPQKSASASSLSKIGTSSQFAIERIIKRPQDYRPPDYDEFCCPLSLGLVILFPVFSPRECLIQLALIKKSFFGLERPRVNHPNLFSIRSIHAENPDSASGHSQIEEPRLNREPRRIRQQPDGKGIFKRFFYFPSSQRAIELKGRIVPIELHFELIVNNTPMQCLYIVFTHGRSFLSTKTLKFFKKARPPSHLDGRGTNTRFTNVNRLF